VTLHTSLTIRHQQDMTHLVETYNSDAE